jgi:hypothetical protein
MYVAIRRYQMAESGSADEVLQRVREGFIPIIKEGPGFLAYYVLDSGGGTVTSISVFEDREGAEASISGAADWVRENVASMFPNPPEIIAGEVAAHELNLPKLGVREVTE